LAQNYSHNVLKRFLHYRQCLIQFQRHGFRKVFSYSLGKEAGATAEQVRKDFSLFGIKGSRRGGYDIDYLLNSINDIFKQNSERLVILVGIGNIGQALINYEGFKENKIHIVAGFDLDPSKYIKRFAIPVYPPDRIPEIVRQYGVKTAIIAVPEISGQVICDLLVSAGIKAILNFSPILLKVPDDVIVNYVNLRNELETLFFYL
jgi:redox-sensing transcriptional repressor